MALSLFKRYDKFYDLSKLQKLWTKKVITNLKELTYTYKGDVAHYKKRLYKVQPFKNNRILDFSQRAQGCW